MHNVNIFHNFHTSSFN